MRILHKISFPFGGYYKNKIILSEKWSGKRAPFRPWEYFDWAFIFLHTIFIICYVDEFLKSSQWEIGIIQNGLNLLKLYVLLLFYSYPIRIPYMHQECMPHSFFKGAEAFPFDKRFEILNNLNFPWFLGGLWFFWPIIVGRILFHFDPNIELRYLELVHGSNNVFYKAFYLIYAYITNTFYFSILNTIIISIIYCRILYKSRQIKK
jgi:hypothetical protein